MLKYLRMGNKRVKLIWWTLIVVTVLTFVGGFIFMGGMDPGQQAAATGALGLVNGEKIEREDMQAAIVEQRAAFRQRFGSDPGEQDVRTIESQAWRGLVNERLLTQQARRLGLKATDREVVITLQASPPQALLGLPDFQTNGQFDPSKYAAAIRNPGINWSPFEDLVRQQLPVRKLQERLVAAVKLSEPELEAAYRRRFEKVALTLVQVPGVFDTAVATPGQEDIDRAYARYKGRFAAPQRASLEVLTVPKTFAEDEVAAARERALGFATEARAGKDFAQLAKDYSEGPGAEQGGQIDRVFQPAEFGPELAPMIAAMKPGDVTDPIQQADNFIVLKLLNLLSDPMSNTPSLRVAQIVVKIRPSETTMLEQRESMRQMRKRATASGLAKAASEKAMTTTRTSFFPFGNTPPQLIDAPELADWAFSAKAGEVSLVVEGQRGFYLAQVAETREAGVPPPADLTDQLRSIAEGEIRVLRAGPRAERLAEAARRTSLEQAAAAEGLSAARVASMSRETPDPRLASAPDIVGAAFSGRPGQVIGPLQMPGGWIVMRIDGALPPDTTSYETIKGQLTNDILQRRQNEFLQGWVTEQRRGAKIQDLRSP